MDTGRSVGRWRSEGDMSGLFPPTAPRRGSPQHRSGPRQQLNRWTSRPNVLRSDSLPYQPGRRNSVFSVNSDLDSSVLGCGSSLGSSAMNSRCSNVSVSSMATPTFVAFPVQRLPLPVRRGGVEERIQRSYQSIPAEIDPHRAPTQSTRATTKTFVLKLNAEATRNRKISRSRSNQSAVQKVAKAASERRHHFHDEGCVTLPDDWMQQADCGSESGDTKCSDLFADIEAAADQQLKQLLLASEASESRTSPRNDAAKVA